VQQRFCRAMIVGNRGCHQGKTGRAKRQRQALAVG